MKKIIILMGVPGSGKGTQAIKLAEKFSYRHISTGNLLRALAEDVNVDARDKKMLAEMKKGKLVADKLIYKLAFLEMEKYFSQNKGVILDGAVRSVKQAKEYQKFLKKNKMEDEVVVVDAHISDEISLKRLLNRKETSNEARVDDNLEVMKKRIKEQGNAIIAPILDFYKKLGILKTVDGEKNIDGVFQEILDVLENE